jgi:hypothetical protein
VQDNLLNDRVSILESLSYEDKCSLLIEKEGILLKKALAEHLPMLRMKGKI